MNVRALFLSVLSGWWLGITLLVAHGADDQVFYRQHIDSYPTKIIIPVRIGGETYPFTLATFTYYTFLDIGLRDALEKTGAKRDPATPREPTANELFDDVQITLGEWKVLQRKVVLTDMGKINDAALLDLRGAIGFSLLSGHTLSLDYDHQSLEIRSAPGPEVKDMKRVDLGNSDSVVVAGIQQEVNGETIQFALTTEKDGYIGLSHEVFVRWVKSGLIKRVTVEGLDQSTGRTDRQITSGNFAGGKLMDTELVGKPVFDNGNGLNELGTAFLIGYDLILDFQKANLFYRLRNAEPPLAVEAMLGAFLERREGKVVITKVKYGGAADSAGIKVGDQVLRLGDLKGTQIDERSKYEFCLKHAGQNVEVEIMQSADGKSVTTQMKMPGKAYQY